MKIFKLTPSSIVFLSIGSCVCFYLGDRFGSLYSAYVAQSSNSITSFLDAMNGIGAAIAAQPFYIDLQAASYGLICLIGFLLAYLYIAVSSKHFRSGEEHGSARWGTKSDIAPLMDKKNPTNNIILSKTEQIKFNGKLPFEYDRNKNIVAIGGSGSGKSYGLIEPNLLQKHSSYVVTDPKGTILPEVGNALKDDYEIRVLNTINFKKSMHYNPLAYIHSQKDILRVVNVLMKNTKGDDQKSGGDPFWDKAESLLYTALIAYLYYEAPLVDRHIPMVSTMLDMCAASETDENMKSTIDYLFENLEKRKGSNHFAVKQYKKFKKAAGKTMKSILISCAARLAPFDIDEVRECMMDDELELDTIGDRKTALFVIISDTDTTFSFISAMMFYQMFNLLCTHADDDCGGKLPVPVRCLLDEFANIGQIPNFEKLIATIRSREISASIILQSQSQLKTIYKDAADTIVGNCDSTLFLGGKEKSTLKEISELLGKETIDSFNQSENRGSQVSHGLTYQKLGKELMTQDELAVMDGGKCIFMLRGVRPFLSDKYDLTKHPNYKYTADADKKYLFDMERYMKRKPAIVKPDEPFEMYELTAMDLQ